MTEVEPNNAIVPAYRTTEEVSELERGLLAFQQQNEVDYDDFRIRLRPDEIAILTDVLAKAESDGSVTMPPRLKGKPWFQKFNDPALNQDLADRYRYLREVPRLVRGFRPANESRQFRLPPGYAGANYTNFEVRCEGHEQAMSFLTRYGTHPPQGLYLYGDVGNGKTRLMVSFAHDLLSQLIEDSQHRIADFAEGAITSYEDLWVNQFQLTKPNVYNLSYDQKLLLDQRLAGSEGAQLTQVFPDQFKAAWTKFPDQPTEVAFATFDDLYDKASDEALITDFVNRGVVIIDDAHHKEDPERLKFLQSLLEKRYSVVMQGPTFITSNLSMEQLFKPEKIDYPERLTARGLSRLNEMFFPIHIGAPDFRRENAAEARARILHDLGIVQSTDNAAEHE